VKKVRVIESGGIVEDVSDYEKSKKRAFIGMNKHIKIGVSLHINY